MDYTNQLILIGTFIMLLGILAGQLSTRLGVPILLAFLSVGMFFGENGPGGIVFNNMDTAYLVCSTALAIILFDGGLRTDLEIFGSALKPAILLSTFGVLITAIIVAAFTIYALGLPPVHGMLMGSIVASTDAAAVFLLLQQRGVTLKKRLRALLEVESGINDPMAIFLTITCVAALTSGGIDVMTTLALFLKQMGLGLVIGYAGGHSIAFMLRFVRSDLGLYPVVVLTGGLFLFGASNMLGGSGFLSVYLAGVTFANCGYKKFLIIRQFTDGIAWLAQLVMLLTLGLLITPANLTGHVMPAILISIVLIIVARPAAVWCCLIGSRFNWKEKTFVSWVGLRGAIPIYLALIPSLSGLEDGFYYLDVAFIVVFTSLILQGWAIDPLARKLNIVEDAEKPAI